MFHKLLFAGILLFALGAAPAAACSSNSEYVAPSNFELVEMADAIGVYAPSRGPGIDRYSFGSVEFRLERTIYGAPPPTVTMDFAELTERHPLAVREDELESPFRYHDYGGGCSRSNFNRGESYLMILEQSREYGWQPVATGGSRAKELYDPDSDWARTVDRYLAVQRLDLSARAVALAAYEQDNSLSAQERGDIRNHLRTPSQWKSASWLIERLDRVTRGEDPDIILSGPIQWRLGNDARAILLTSLANGRKPEARSLFERLVATPNLPEIETFIAEHYFGTDDE